MAKKIGLALGSGGFRGPAHVGIIKSLTKHGFKISYLSGASIGALVAAHYALYESVEELEKEFLSDWKEKLPLVTDISASGGLLSGKKVEKYFKKVLDNKSFSDTQIPLKIVATDLISGKPVIFNKGELSEAVRASSSIPLTFKPASSRGMLLIDGGVSDPIPGELLKHMGADIIIGVNLYNSYEFKKKKIKTITAAMRAFEIMLYNAGNQSKKECDIFVEPNTADFYDIPRWKKYVDSKVIKSLISAGEKAMDAQIPALKKLLN